MTEFTDGTAKGKTLSLVELEKRLEELTEKYNAIPEIEYGVKTGLTVDPNSGNSFVVNYAKNSRAHRYCLRKCVMGEIIGAGLLFQHHIILSIYGIMPLLQQK